MKNFFIIIVFAVFFSCAFSIASKDIAEKALSAEEFLALNIQQYYLVYIFPSLPAKQQREITEEVIMQVFGRKATNEEIEREIAMTNLQSLALHAVISRVSPLSIDTSSLGTLQLYLSAREFAALEKDIDAIDKEYNLTELQKNRDSTYEEYEQEFEKCTKYGATTNTEEAYERFTQAQDQYARAATDAINLKNEIIHNAVKNNLNRFLQKKTTNQR